MRIKILELLKKFIATDCVFKKVFHMYCPGCGGTRAWKALIRLNILQSLYDNPVVILLILTEIAVAITRGIDKRRKKCSLYKVRIAVYVVFLVLWFLFFLIRNYLLMKCGIDMLGDFKTH